MTVFEDVWIWILLIGAKFVLLVGNFVRLLNKK